MGIGLRNQIFFLVYTCMKLMKYDEALDYIEMYNQIFPEENDGCFVPISGVISVKELWNEIQKRKNLF